MAKWPETDIDTAISMRDDGATNVQIAEAIGQTRKAVGSWFRRRKKAVNQESKQKKSDVISAAALAPQINLDQAATIRELEKKNAVLHRQLTWAQHAESSERTGGVFTLRASDHHFGDANHLLSCCRSLEAKVVEVIKQYEPEKIYIVAGDDWVAGRGIYREQDLDSVVQDVNQQCELGAMKARQLLLDIRKISKAPITWHITRGNHDYSNGHSLTEFLHLLLANVNDDIDNIDFVMHWDRIILNLAAKGTYNVLIRHGFGHSKLSPNSPAFVSAVKDEMLGMQRSMQPHEHIRRVLSGHTHWISVGLEHIVGLYFDTTGGLQRNTRIRLGANQRPSGWICYVSPKGMENQILEPIQLVPDEDTYKREISDPYLALSNTKDAAETIKAFYELMRAKGSYAQGGDFGVVNEGR